MNAHSAPASAEPSAQRMKDTVAALAAPLPAG